MASASEQLAQNMNLGVFAKAKELQQRLTFYFIYSNRLPHRNIYTCSGYGYSTFQAAFNSGGGGLLTRLNMFAGGAVERMAIFALNVMPYISASIIMTLMKGSSDL